MEVQLAAIQRGLLQLLAASVVIAVCVRPAPKNRLLVGALDELTTFERSFDRRRSERALLDQALVQGGPAVVIGLQGLEAELIAEGGPKLVVGEGAMRVAPLGAIQLASLQDIERITRPSSTVQLGVLDASTLARSLTLRLSPKARSGAFRLEGVELLPAAVGGADVELEQTASQLRAENRKRLEELDQKAREVKLLEYRVKAQSGRRARTLFKTRVALEETRREMAASAEAQGQAQQRYEAAVKRATRPRSLSKASSAPSGAALARVRVQDGAERMAFDIPVRLEQREVRLSAARHVDFAATRRAALWSEVQGKSPAEAIALVQSRFNWHFSRVAVLGIELVGTSVLQWLPAVLPCLLALLLVCLRRAETSYSPFSTQVPDSPPSVGFENRFFEFVTILVMPLAAVVSAATALVLNERVPIGPALTGAACVALGVYAYTRVQELREQTQSIVRSHSMPPSAPRG